MKRNCLKGKKFEISRFRLDDKLERMVTFGESNYGIGVSLVTRRFLVFDLKLKILVRTFQFENSHFQSLELKQLPKTNLVGLLGFSNLTKNYKILGFSFPEIYNCDSCPYCSGPKKINCEICGGNGYVWIGDKCMNCTKNTSLCDQTTKFNFLENTQDYNITSNEFNIEFANPKIFEPDQNLNPDFEAIIPNIDRRYYNSSISFKKNKLQVSIVFNYNLRLPNQEENSEGSTTKKIFPKIFTPTSPTPTKRRQLLEYQKS